MHCDQCGNENPAINRYCGQCGSQLTVSPTKEQVDTKKADAGPVLRAFNQDIQRQQSQLTDFRQYDGDKPETPTTPLAQLATAPADFGPVSSLLTGPPEPSTEPDRPPSQQWFSPPRDSRRSGAQITGPSFLGLSDPEGGSDSDLSYLYEDEPHASHARVWVAALVAIAVAGLIVYEWRNNPDLQTRAQQWVNRAWGRKGTDQYRQSPAPQNTTASSTGAPVAAPNAPPPTTEPTSRASETQSRPENPAVRPDAEQGQVETPPSAPPRASPQGSKKQQTATTARQDTPDQEDSAETKRRSIAEAERSQTPGKALVQKADQYLYGRGVAKNCDQALVYLRSAADLGNAAARSKLGGLYATGNCVPLDRARAYHWFSLARQSGDRNVWLNRNMTMLWSSMTPEERSRSSVSRH